MSQRTYSSSLPVSITINDQGDVVVGVDLTDISEAVYDNNGSDNGAGEPVTAFQHGQDIATAVEAKVNRRIVVHAIIVEL